MVTAATIIALIQTIMAILPGAISTVEEVAALAQQFFATLNGREPTQQEQDDLQAKINSDVAEALTPLPPE